MKTTNLTMRCWNICIRNWEIFSLWHLPRQSVCRCMCHALINYVCMYVYVRVYVCYIQTCMCMSGTLTERCKHSKKGKRKLRRKISLKCWNKKLKFYRKKWEKKSDENKYVLYIRISKLISVYLLKSVGNFKQDSFMCQSCHDFVSGSLHCTYLFTYFSFTLRVCVCVWLYVHATPWYIFKIQGLLF